MTTAFSHIAIVGMGLIGGSFAAALKEYGLALSITGVDRDEATLRYAQQCGLIDHGLTSITPSLAGCSHLFVATPVGTFAQIFQQVAHHIPTVKVVDFGSVKGELSLELHQRFPQLDYLPAHPIAGSERSGIHAADSRLFMSRKFILTPLPKTSPDLTFQMQEVLQKISAHVCTMDPVEHDEIFGAVSHLPHMIAYALVDAISAMEKTSGLELSRYPGAGFRDFTRIASSDETMWTDIALANRSQLLNGLESFQNSLGNLRSAIENNDSESLKTLFRDARRYRDAIVRHMESTHA
ncbi:prephenate dehydrogenase [Desulfurispira natronophila]|uniref:prephenate dehydrogenase n=1 Tax=Desulfurispira natronophila TaxID=682562 RepID=A0A7W7Y468_9BACT|nr:prephenate dehydrogenase/arogenate dehydrogenase family protein [Desulfurispira natronophila]MBB5021724.1 prephenate dehydrogenase [Desulfurispira natronophila]